MSDTVTYRASATPTLDRIEPRFGSVRGNKELISLYGNFPDGNKDSSVKFDNRDCVIIKKSKTLV